MSALGVAPDIDASPRPGPIRGYTTARRAIAFSVATGLDRPTAMYANPAAQTPSGALPPAHVVADGGSMLRRSATHPIRAQRVHVMRPGIDHATRRRTDLPQIKQVLGDEPPRHSASQL